MVTGLSEAGRAARAVACGPRALGKYGVCGNEFILLSPSLSLSSSRGVSILRLRIWKGSVGFFGGILDRSVFWRASQMEHDETGCQAREGPILCANNCGFFGSAATMNLCSKCHKKHVLEQEQAKLAAASIDSIVNDAGSSGGKHVVIESANVDVASSLVEAKTILTKPSDAPAMSKEVEVKAKEGPNRCNTCRKRVGLTGFNCRCGNVFCGEHRYHNKHNCPFDYKTAARDAIAKANPLIKSEKLDKI